MKLLEASGNVTIIEPDVSFGDIEAGQTATSEDTFRLRVDRSEPIDTAVISWQVLFGELPGDAYTSEIILETSGIAGDLNEDGKVNFMDFARLAATWAGSVEDWQNLNIIAENWLTN